MFSLGSLAALPYIGTAISFLSGFSLKRILIVGGGGALALFLTYNVGLVKGRLAERAKCKEAEVRAELVQAKLDLDIQKQIAKRVQGELENLNTVTTGLQGKVADYETELQKRPVSAACLLDDNDVRRLRGIGGTAKARPKRPS